MPDYVDQEGARRGRSNHGHVLETSVELQLEAPQPIAYAQTARVDPKKKVTFKNTFKSDNKKKQSKSKTREVVVLNDKTTKRLYKAGREAAKKVEAQRQLRDHHIKYHELQSKPVLSKGTKELLSASKRDGATSKYLSMSKNLPAHRRYDIDRKNREAAMDKLKGDYQRDMEETHPFAPDISGAPEKGSKERGKSHVDDSAAIDSSRRSA